MVCVFINLKQDTLIVEKQAVGGDDSFAFRARSLGTSPWLPPTVSPAPSSAGWQPGTYAISETVPAGWDLTSATCDNGASPANINLAPGETVNCTFQNTKRGSLTVAKLVIGTADATFVFTSSTLSRPPSA